ncbi:hypothetical protein CRENBAI_003838, partial [Crenichthys baileyi]
FGNISPHTEGGRIFCILYALLGIPLFGFLLAGVGDQLGTIFGKGIAKVEKMIVKWKVSQTKIRVISTLLFILFGCLIFVALPAVIFKHIEGWSTLESIYFVVITLTTIGFGDFVAGEKGHLTEDGPKDKSLRGSDRETLGAIQLAHDDQSTFQETVHLGMLGPDTYNVVVHHLAGKTQGTCQLQSYTWGLTLCPPVTPFWTIVREHDETRGSHTTASHGCAPLCRVTPYTQCNTQKLSRIHLRCVPPQFD